MTERTSSGALLVFASLIGFIGVVCYTLGGSDGASALFGPTRILILAAAVTSALGLALLEGVLREAGERVLSRLGLIGFVLGAALIVIAEGQLIDGVWNAASPTRVYVVLAFLAQAAYGGALLRAHMLPTWVGRATVAWNLGWLALLIAVDVSSGPGYYPVLHYFAPLLIGVQILRRPEAATSQLGPFI